MTKIGVTTSGTDFQNFVSQKRDLAGCSNVHIHHIGFIDPFLTFWPKINQVFWPLFTPQRFGTSCNVDFPGLAACPTVISKRAYPHSPLFGCGEVELDYGCLGVPLHHVAQAEGVLKRQAPQLCCKTGQNSIQKGKAFSSEFKPSLKIRTDSSCVLFAAARIETSRASPSVPSGRRCGAESGLWP